VATNFTTGTMLAGKYQILDLLGQGGMGAVYLAENVDIGRKVAIKVLRADLAEDPQSLARFKLEARAAAAIGEPGIVEVLDLGQLPDGGAYIVMERLEGETLRERLARGGTVSPYEAVNLMGSVLDTLASAHDRGIIHRDLKPDNIWLTARPPPLTKILDFGISKFRGTEDMALTRTGVVMGTPLYMSPEQARGTRDVGVTTDIYAIGAILYEALSGQPPFPGESYNEVLAKVLTETSRPLSQLRPDVPEPLVQLIQDILSKVPSQRPADARSAARLLRATLGAQMMTPLPLDHVVAGGTAPDQTHLSIPPPVLNSGVPPSAATRPDDPPTHDAQAQAPGVDPVGPRTTAAPTPAITPKRSRAGLLIGLALGLLVLVGGGSAAAWFLLGPGGASALPTPTQPTAQRDAGPAPHQNPFPFGEHPGLPESELCAQQRCRIYASTEHELFSIDPHAPGNVQLLCAFRGAVGSAPVADIAVDADGMLWAITQTDLVRVIPETCDTSLAAHLSPAGKAFNGLTFTRQGDLLAANPSGELSRIDRTTGEATPVGTVGTGLGCSGDLVAMADGSIFATARELNSPNLSGDWLVRIDPTTFTSTRVKTLGLGDIYGLATWNGTLYGFDRAGRTLAIDGVTGKASLLSTTPGRAFYGAAVTPLAPER
jgi:serine/threonine protein kinase